MRSEIEPLRERLKKDYMDALSQLIEYFETSREYPEAIGYAERLLHCNELCESTYVTLMRLHALNNDRAKAINIFQECKTILKRELDIEPADETRNYYNRLVSNTIDDPGSPEEDGEYITSDWPLVGRRTEWQTLQRAWKQVLSGDNLFVCIFGDPGIGKSRLGLEFLERIRRQGYITTYSRCYETAGVLSYGPVTDWLRDDGIRRYLDDLDPVWLHEIARLMPELLADHPELSKPEPLNEAWQRNQFFEALTKAFLVRRKPKLLFLDDLQWCDRETLEWLGYLFHTSQIKHLLVIGTLRPVEGTAHTTLQQLLADLRSSGNVKEVYLDGLSEEESLELAAEVAGGMKVSPPNIYGESEGNPLFVIETVRQSYFNESGSAINSQESGIGIESKKQPGHPHLDFKSQREYPPVPPKVFEVISSRFEQLDENTREFVWLAAAIGREFNTALLAEASGQEELAVIQALEELLRHHIIRELRSGAYDFSHDKMREVAYYNMSSARRRWLHRQIAGAIENIHAGTLDDYSSRLAYHYDRGGKHVKAIHYYQNAAVHARRILADREAVDYTKRVIMLLDTIPDENQRRELERNVLIGDLISQVHLKGYSSGNIPGICNRIRLLRKILGKTTPVPVLRTLAISSLTSGDLETSLEIGREIFSRAKESGNNVELVEACYVLGVTLDKQGKFTEADEHLKSVVDNYNFDQQQEHIRVYGQDPFVICKVRRALLLWKLGQKEMANRMGEEAFESASELKHPFSLNYVKTILAWKKLLQKNFQKTQQVAKGIIRSSTCYGFRLWQAFGKIFLGSTLSKQEKPDEGISLIREGIAVLDQIDYTIDRPYFYSLLAITLADQKKYEEAGLLMDTSLKKMDQTGERWMEAEVHRIHGEIHLKTEPAKPEKARNCFEKALEVARHQKAVSFEQRALVSLEKVSVE
jgi:tetratricopeptide (TPR) repeat protein